MNKGLFVLILLLNILACGKRDGLAPVVDRKWVASNPSASTHTVVRGETLYAVAFRYDQDYRALAKANRLDAPYSLRVGQVIQLRHRVMPAVDSLKKPQTRRQDFTQKKTVQKSRSNRWDWPVHGKVVAHFSPKHGKKGINIVGVSGEKIHAASSGIVAYAGNGISGYGNLIIIRQGTQYLMAYGNNARNLVHEGQRVKQGQVIATMGMIERKYYGLHFEIRKMGKPVNPLRYLR